MNLLKFAALLLLSPCLARGEIHVHAPVDATTLLAWVQDTKSAKTRELSCAETQQVDGTTLCLFNTSSTMAKFLARASLFGTGASANVANDKDPLPKGIVVKSNSDLAKRYASLVKGGFAFTGKDLTGFYAAAEEACATKKDPDVCLSPAEKELFAYLLPKIKKNPKFQLTTAAVDHPKVEEVIIPHELSHARYAQNEKYRQTVDKFWQSLPPESQERFKTFLGLSYDVRDPDLFKDELQAHLLADWATGDTAKAFKAALMQEGFLPLNGTAKTAPVTVSK